MTPREMELDRRRHACTGVRGLHELVSRRAPGSRASPNTAVQPPSGRRTRTWPSVGTSSSVYLSSTSNRVAGQHVGDAHREHVGTALLEQRGALPFFLGGLELRLRLLALLDLRHDPHVADRHRHAVDGRARGRREDVAGMQRPLSAVLVDLPDGHVGNHAGDRDVHARVLERQTIDVGIAAFNEEVRRECFVGSRSLGSDLRRGIERHEGGAEGEVRGRASELRVSCRPAEQRALPARAG